MKVQPVKTRCVAGYPLRLTLDAHPEWLRVVPMRWRESAVVMGALALVCGVAGSVPARADDTGAATTATPQNPSPAAATTAPVPTKIAPLFLHGGGVATFGGEPDANNKRFMTEEDMRQIVVDDCKAAGIAFKPDVITLKDLPMPEPWNKNPPPPQYCTVTETLDGTDTDKHISYEVVSRTDMEHWVEVQGGGGAKYDAQMAAKIFSESLATLKPEGTVGIFYDPLDGKHQDSVDDLHAQVKDFLAWLKAEGVM